MAGYKSGQVNVGSLINPTDGISRSLNQLSNMYGKQAAEEQSQLNIDEQRRISAGKEASRQARFIKQDNVAAQTRKENLVFRNAQEGRQQKTFDVKEQQRLAEGAFNKAAAAYNPNTAKYTLDSLDPNVAKDITRGRDLISGVQSDFVNFASGDGSDESLRAASAKYEKYLGTTANLTHTAKLAAVEKYEEGLKGTRDQLKTLDAKGKQDLIGRISQEKFGGRLDAIDKDISSGRYLVRADKVKSFISQLPKSILENVPYDTIYKTIENQTGGVTAKDLTDGETTRVKNLNTANNTVYNRSMTAINAARKPSGKSGSYTKTADIAKGDGILEAIDIGSSDNKRVNDAYKDMLSQGINPVVAATVIKQSIDYGVIEDSFVGQSSDSAAYDNVINLAKTLNKQLSGSRKSGGRIPKLNLNVEVARDLSTIRRQGVKFNPDNTRIRDLINPEIISSLRGYNLGPELVIPQSSPDTATTLPEAPSAEVPSASNNFYRDVPEGSDFVPSAEEQEFNRNRTENYNSLGSQAGRAGRDVMNFVNRLPANSATPALNLFKAGNIGTKAMLPAITRNSKAIRSSVSKEMADEALNAVVAAKTAARSPARNVVKPGTLSKSASRVEAARKKAWNNDKVAKETTDMWDNYWLSNLKN